SASAKSGRAGEVFAALGKRLAADPKAAKGTNQVVQFKVREPEAMFVVDFTMSPPKISGDVNGHKPAAVFSVADEDLVRLADGTASAQDLYQRGKLRVDGDVTLAKQLSFLDKLV
ncbi:MAG TPA: SCP2 sterol-binding domain-containing protein, partial [Nevskiaceae bacterium]|nr:SCP2 sterol-binding domain-containing protein [Nevskiaceae bacterium]